MKDTANLKFKAQSLRKSGLSYGEIAKNLSISKSTAKYWTEHIKLKNEYKKRLYTKQVELLKLGSQSSHNRRQREIRSITERAEKEIESPIQGETYKLFGAALYWAEGNKIDDFTITNSDPLLIQFMVQWFRTIFNLKPTDFKAHLNLYPQQNEKSIKHFWSEITDIPLENFGKTFIKPVNKNYKKNTLYYGTIKVRVSKGTNFRHRVFGWINKVLKDQRINVEITERKWYKLKANYKRP